MNEELFGGVENTSESIISKAEQLVAEYKNSPLVQAYLENKAVLEKLENEQGESFKKVDPEFNFKFLIKTNAHNIYPEFSENKNSEEYKTTLSRYSSESLDKVIKIKDQLYQMMNAEKDQAKKQSIRDLYMEVIDFDKQYEQDCLKDKNNLYVQALERIYTKTIEIYFLALTAAKEKIKRLVESDQEVLKFAVLHAYLGRYPSGGIYTEPIKSKVKELFNIDVGIVYEKISKNHFKFISEQEPKNTVEENIMDMAAVSFWKKPEKTINLDSETVMTDTRFTNLVKEFDEKIKPLLVLDEKKE